MVRGVVFRTLRWNTIIIVLHKSECLLDCTWVAKHRMRLHTIFVEPITNRTMIWDQAFHQLLYWHYQYHDKRPSNTGPFLKTCIHCTYTTQNGRERQRCQPIKDPAPDLQTAWQTNKIHKVTNTSTVTLTLNQNHTHAHGYTNYTENTNTLNNDNNVLLQTMSYDSSALY